MLERLTAQRFRAHRSAEVGDQQQVINWSSRWAQELQKAVRNKQRRGLRYQITNIRGEELLGSRWATTGAIMCTSWLRAVANSFRWTSHAQAPWGWWSTWWAGRRATKRRLSALRCSASPKWGAVRWPENSWIVDAKILKRRQQHVKPIITSHLLLWFVSPNCDFHDEGS